MCHKRNSILSRISSILILNCVKLIGARLLVKLACNIKKKGHAEATWA
jgi:hypothetical protein